MNGKEVIEKHLKYNLQSWSVQGNLNPKAIEKADNIYLKSKSNIYLKRKLVYNKK